MVVCGLSIIQPMLDQATRAHLKQARWAVRRWAAFPVERQPRPLVLAGPDIFIPKGFTSEEAQSAFDEGLLEWIADVPERVRGALRDGASHKRRTATLRPLTITDARRDEYEFVTDRGRVRLPSYQLRGPGIIDSIWLLDPAVGRWQPDERAGGRRPPAPTQISMLQAPAELTEDDRTIVFSWLGATPAVETFPRAKVVETKSAVSAVAIRESTGATGWFVAAGVMHRVRARLSRPLGARVFVDLHGNPVAVTPTLTGSLPDHGGERTDPG
jgi:hypothetical protein